MKQDADRRRKYEAKMSTTFSKVDEGIEEIERKIQKSRRTRINNIPMKSLDELEPLSRDKDLKAILPLSEEPTEELKGLGEIATTKARIHVDFEATKQIQAPSFFQL